MIRKCELKYLLLLFVVVELICCREKQGKVFFIYQYAGAIYIKKKNKTIIVNLPSFVLAFRQIVVPVITGL